MTPALMSWQRAATLDPESPDARMVRGLLLLRQRRHGAAMDAVRAAASFGPVATDMAAFASFVLASAGLGNEATRA